MKITPLLDYYLLEKIEKSDKLPSGIYVPPESVGGEKVDQAIVIAIPSGSDGKITLNSTVIYQYQYAIKVDDSNHLLVKKENIIAVIS
jgi:co-chaperonin GroES (HSP10)